MKVRNEEREKERKEGREEGRKEGRDMLKADYGERYAFKSQALSFLQFLLIFLPLLFLSLFLLLSLPELLFVSRGTTPMSNETLTLY